MENTPKMHVAGNAPEEEKIKAQDARLKNLFEHLESLPEPYQKMLSKTEYPKTSNQIAVIDFVNKETNRLMEELGVPPFSIPEDNYHIIPTESMAQLSPKARGATEFRRQGIFFDRSDCGISDLSFGSTAFHETLHLKGSLSMEVEEKNKQPEDTIFRAGMIVYSTQKSERSGRAHEHFRGLEEAVVSTQQKKAISALRELPFLAKEKEWMQNEEALKKIEEVIQKNPKLSSGDIVWVDPKTKEITAISYSAQRKTLSYICEEIQKEFPEEYATPDDVFREFLKSHFTGSLRTIARLTDKTFGEGSFRILGNMGTDEKSGILHLETFEKARNRQLKAKRKNP